MQHEPHNTPYYSATYGAFKHTAPMQNMHMYYFTTLKSVHCISFVHHTVVCITGMHTAAAAHLLQAH
jgi:hypothetical protein